MKILLLLFSWLMAGLCWAGPDGERSPKAIPEYTMKALYLYNFAQLTEWPAGAAQESFRLCIIGQEEVATVLDGLRGRSVSGRSLQVVRLEAASEAKTCDLLYVGEDRGERSATLLSLLRDIPVLTVTDDQRLARAKPMVVIFQMGPRLAFDVDLAAARRGRIKFSSKLLQLANQVLE